MLKVLPDLGCLKTPGSAAVAEDCDATTLQTVAMISRNPTFYQ